MNALAGKLEAIIVIVIVMAIKSTIIFKVIKDFQKFDSFICK